MNLLSSRTHRAKTLVVVLLVGLMCGCSLAQVATLTQSIDSSTVTAGNSAQCGSGAGTHAESSYWRSYSLGSVGQSDSIQIVGVRFGVEVATSILGSQPVQVRFYRDPTPGDPAPLSDLQLASIEQLDVLDTALQVSTHFLRCPTFVLNTGSEDLVVELYTPDGTGVGGFIVGSNANGQIGPSYVSSATCNVHEPTDIATLGFPSMHIILDILYVVFGTGAENYPGTGDDLLMNSGVNGVDPNGGGPCDAKTVATGDIIAIRIESPTGSLAAHSMFVLSTIATGHLDSGGIPVPDAGAPSFPGIYIDFPGGQSVLPTSIAIGGIPGIGPLLLPPGGFEVSFAWPGGPHLTGNTLVLQGLVTSPFTQNLVFATTNGQEFQGF